ncbi:MAG: enoyl-CoA hydratase [Halieaceae bacterium]
MILSSGVGSAEAYAMETSPVTVETIDRVYWLTLNRPEQRNPLSLEMIRALTGALKEAYADSAIRVVVITAEGPVFSAGHDLKEMMQGETESANDYRDRIDLILDQCAALMTGIVTAPKPVIASVQGTATAAGCQLVSTCDLAIAASDARFCTPGVNIGTFCTTPLVGIGRNLSRKHAMEMALTGDMFSAKDARKFGLINRHVAPEDLRSETQALAEKIASRSPQSIRDGKAAFYAQIEMPLEQAFAQANRVMREALIATEDGVEGRRAFIEKRSPRWSDT